MVKLSNSTKLSAKFGGQLSDEFLHDGVNLFVTHRLLGILEDEVDGIRLLAGRELVALIDVEEFDLLQELLLRLTGDVLYLLELYALVDEQGEVAADGGELRYVGELHFLLADNLHEGCPVELGIIDGGVDVELTLQLLGDDTQFDEFLSSTVLDGESCREDGIVGLLADNHAGLYTNAGEDIINEGIQFGK